LSGERAAQLLGLHQAISSPTGALTGGIAQGLGQPTSTFGAGLAGLGTTIGGFGALRSLGLLGGGGGGQAQDEIFGPPESLAGGRGPLAGGF
jgi:hypothetical protein